MRLCLQLVASVCLATLLAGLSGAAAQTPTRNAIVFANDKYPGDPLQRAAVDGVEIRKMLTRANYKVAEYTDARGTVSDVHANIATKEAFLEQWRKFLASLTSGGTAVFYFTGHGAEVDGDSLLLPVGIAPDQATEVRLLNEGISVRQLFDEFKTRQAVLQAKNASDVLHGIFIIDACRSKPKPQDARGSGTKSPVNGKPSAIPIAPPAGIFVLYATSAHQVAHSRLGPDDTDDTKPSVYTRTLIDLLGGEPPVGCDRAKGCSLQSLARLVRWQVHLQVARAYGGTQPQTPAFFDALVLSPGRMLTMRGDEIDEAAEKVRPQEAPAGLIRSEAGSEAWECEDCPHLVVVPKGPFKMGEFGRDSQERSSEAKADTDDPRLQVTIREPFAIGITEVTVAQFRAFLVDTKGGKDGICPPTHPVCRRQPSENPAIGVSWDEAQQYVDWLNTTRLKSLALVVGPASKTGYYRLPTEAEWEYAARAGSPGRYTFGDEERKLCQYGNGADQELFQMTYVNHRCSDGVGRRVAPVKSYKPNDFGLYDVHGNVWEWVIDCWTPAHDRAHKANGGAQPLPANATACRRVLKGGAWFSAPEALRLAKRVSFDQGHGGRPTVGFRVVRVLPKP